MWRGNFNLNSAEFDEMEMNFPAVAPTGNYKRNLERRVGFSSGGKRRDGIFFAGVLERLLVGVVVRWCQTQFEVNNT